MGEVDLRELGLVAQSLSGKEYGLGVRVSINTLTKRFKRKMSTRYNQVGHILVKTEFLLESGELEWSRDMARSWENTRCPPELIREHCLDLLVEEEGPFHEHDFQIEFCRKNRKLCINGYKEG